MIKRSSYYIELTIKIRDLPPDDVKTIVDINNGLPETLIIANFFKLLNPLG